MKKIMFSACSVLAALLLTAVIGFSQDEGVHKGACKPDVEKFCKGIKPGGGRAWACLKSHETELGQACRDHMAMMREKGKEFHKACMDDSKKFCKGIPHGKGRIVSCLKSHEAELSASCKAFFDKD